MFVIACVLILQSVQAADLRDAISKLAEYKVGGSRAALLTIESAVRGATPETRGEVESALLQVVANTNATVDARGFACEQLSLIGGPASVPMLAALLQDAKLSFPARQALQRIDDPKALAALRDALGRLQGSLQVGIIHALGQLRDAPSVNALGALVGKSPDVSQAAAFALGQIGTVDAARALVNAEKSVPADGAAVWMDACLSCADALCRAGQSGEAVPIYRMLVSPGRPRQVRIAALRELAMVAPADGSALILEILNGNDQRLSVAAASLVAVIPGNDVEALFIAELPKLSPAVQVPLIAAFGTRAASKSVPALVKALESQNVAVRIAALRALALLDDGASVPAIVERAGHGDKEEQKVARETLLDLSGPSAGQAMLEQLETGAPEHRNEIVRVIAAHPGPGAFAAVLKCAKSKDAALRAETCGALAAMAADEDIPDLIALLSNASEDARADVENALVGALARLPQNEATLAKVLAARENAAPALQPSFLRAVAATRTPKALDTLRSATADRDAEVRAAAIRALSGWRDATPAPDLLKLAQEAADPAQRILALRGYIRMAGLDATPAADRLAICRKALELATRIEEKRLVLGALGLIASLDALKFAEAQLGQRELQVEAATACVAIAAAVQKKYKAQARAALENVLKQVPDDKKSAKVRAEAKAVLAGEKQPKKPADDPNAL